MRITALRSDQLLVDARQAAGMLGLADRTFRALVAQGVLEKVALGSMRVARYRVEDIRALAAGHPGAWPPRVANPEPTPTAPKAAASGARPHRVTSGRSGR